MAHERKKLSDILSDAERKAYFANWSEVKAAGDYLLPKGEYVALLIEGNPHQAKTGTKGFKFVFEIAEGEYAGRKVFHDLWLTEAAKPQTKRDLDELGITDPDRQLAEPMPQDVVVALNVTVQKDEDGTERNRVRRLKFLRIQEPDAFAPQEDEAADTSFDTEAFDAKPQDSGPADDAPRPASTDDGPYGKGGDKR